MWQENFEDTRGSQKPNVKGTEVKQQWSKERKGQKNKQ